MGKSNNSAQVAQHHDEEMYMAAIALPATPPPEAIEANVRYCRWFYVGEYPEQSTALEQAKIAAIRHKADSYSVVLPYAEGYADNKAKLGDLKQWIQEEAANETS